MKAVLIFDNVNDLLYHKWDSTFLERMKAFYELTALPNQMDEVVLADTHSVSQLLSPIITSQRVMAAQFGNTYSSMQCKDGTTLVFDEWLDHLLLIISQEGVDECHRELLDCKTFVQHLCGQNINLLHSPVYQKWLTALIESRTKGDSIPGAIGVIGESGATAAALSALKSAAKETKCANYQHYHLLLFVGDKLLVLYSSRGSADATPPDLLLLGAQCVAAQEFWSGLEKTDGSKEQPADNSRLPWLSEENSAIVYLCGAAGGGGGGGAPSSPHSLHVAALAARVTLAVLVDLEMRDIGIAAHNSSQILSNLNKQLLQRNLELIPTTLDALESSVKKLTEALRKNKANARLCARLSACAQELRKACAAPAPAPASLSPEGAAGALQAALQIVSEQLRPDIPSLNMEAPLRELRAILSPYVDFLRVKAMRCFSLDSGPAAAAAAARGGSLTLHKYVEEFPGLVHFVLVDRGAGRCLRPDPADCAHVLTPHTVQRMVGRCFKLVREGYSAATWRAGALHAVYVLWWERGGGGAGGGGGGVAPRAAHPAAARALPPPGDIMGSFYRQLTEQAFPGNASNVTVKELLCIHLGLVPSATAVEQARRLAGTVRDVADLGRPAADLL